MMEGGGGGGGGAPRLVAQGPRQSKSGAASEARDRGAPIIDMFMAAIDLLYSESRISV